MRKRDARRLATDLGGLGGDEQARAEIYAAATHAPTRHQLRVTTEVAAVQAGHVAAGLLTVDAFFRRAWGLDVAGYFATPDPVMATPAREGRAHPAPAKPHR